MGEAGARELGSLSSSPGCWENCAVGCSSLSWSPRGENSADSCPESSSFRERLPASSPAVPVSFQETVTGSVFGWGTHKGMPMSSASRVGSPKFCSRSTSSPSSAESLSWVVPSFSSSTLVLSSASCSPRPGPVALSLPDTPAALGLEAADFAGCAPSLGPAFAVLPLGPPESMFSKLFWSLGAGAAETDPCGSAGWGAGRLERGFIIRIEAKGAWEMRGAISRS